MSLSFPNDLGKVELAETMVRHARLAWDESCWSAGDTVTLTGLNRVLQALEQEMGRPSDPHLDEKGTATMTTVAPAAPQTEDERQAVEQEIRDNLAHLSGVGRFPSGRGGPLPFGPEDVDFTGSAWLHQVMEVEPWLYLVSSISGHTPDELLSSLVLGLGFTRPEEAVELQPDGTRRLNADGLDSLRRQTDRAVKIYSDVFEAELDKDAPDLGRAFRAWEEAWTAEEEADEEELGAEPGKAVQAKTGSWSITDFAARARKHQLNLSPTYQRGNVWPNTDAQLLIASILRGIPLPSVILLKSTDAQQPFEVVDGKQRLTSILRFMGAHPVALRRVAQYAQQFPEADLENLFRTDYPAFRRAVAKATGKALTSAEEREYYFPFPLGRNEKDLPGVLQQMAGRYYTEIEQERIAIAGTMETLEEVFQQTSEYRIPVIIFEEATPRQIHEVFNLYNKQGKHLNAEEIRNAVFHDVPLTLALLAAAGDVDDIHDPRTVAKVLTRVWPQVESLSDHLGQYGMGKARYRRTKILSWLLSLLVFDGLTDDGKLRLRSTSQHINAFLHRVQENRADPMRQEAVVQRAAVTLASAVEAHLAADDAWAPNFRGGKAAWEELTLVASLLGVALALVADPDGIDSRLEDAADELARSTASKEWRRPTKTQTKEQWRFIATVALGIVETLGLTPSQADEAVRQALGTSGVRTLVALRAEHQEASGQGRP
ncbi:DUF262 domain-containing protein [Desertihabitans brevis]|uniref:DUF262 domain-containing protein n=2 Tax=Desertihabitans brevis TaxID=2268447 RepID=A0A367YW87_9ACTN|nr:DUF262 domain-containing protein [Desertihabitans brevis]